MSAGNANRAAFPTQEGAAGHTPGLTKREYIAALALQGLLASDPNWSDMKYPTEEAVRAADALLEALER